MWRPVTRNLLIFSCGVCLCIASGCSVFRSGMDDALVAEPPRHLPVINEAPPADVSAVDVSAVGASAVGASAVGASATIPRAIAAADTEAEPAAPSSCYVEIRALGEKPKRIRMLLEDAPYVQKVLEQTGLVKQFRNMHIELSRKLPDGTRHKLEVRYDAKQDHVISAFDYALHPNDLLVIQQDSATSLDEMLKKLAGPLAR